MCKFQYSKNTATTCAVIESPCVIMWFGLSEIKGVWAAFKLSTAKHPIDNIKRTCIRKTQCPLLYRKSLLQTPSNATAILLSEMLWNVFQEADCVYFNCFMTFSFTFSPDTNFAYTIFPHDCSQAYASMLKDREMRCRNMQHNLLYWQLMNMMRCAMTYRNCLGEPCSWHYLISPGFRTSLSIDYLGERAIKHEHTRFFQKIVGVKMICTVLYCYCSIILSRKWSLMIIFSLSYFCSNSPKLYIF